MAPFSPCAGATPLRAGGSVALTRGNPPGQRMPGPGLSWNDCHAVLPAAVPIAVATVMAAAVRLAEENQGCV